MIWRWQDSSLDWRKRFALFPIFLRDGPERQIIWLQWVWKRDYGLCTLVSTDDPFPTPPAALKDHP